MIVTVTLNPAVDQTLVIDHFSPGDTNRVLESHIDPGGKGINVSRALRELGRESLAAGLAPGSLGRFVEHSLLEQGILCDFVHTRGQTRTNLTVVDTYSRATTLLSYRGPEIDPRHLHTLEHRLRRILGPSDWLVVAGSIPPPITVDAYPQLLNLAHQSHSHTVLDADAEALAAGLTGMPEIVKTNHHEAERLVGYELDTDEALFRAADEMRRAGAEKAIITASARGAVAVTNEGSWRCRPPETEVSSAVGAGDALLAGLLYSLDEGGSFTDALRWGTAAGTAACLFAGKQLCHEADVRRLLPKVVVEPVSRQAAAVPGA